MPNFAVGTTFTGKDKLTRKILGFGKAMDKFGGKSTRAFRAASRAGGNFGSVVKGILTAGLIQRGLSLISMGVRTAATDFIEFDDSIVAATARFKDLPVGSAKAAAAMEQLRKKARAVGATTQFTAAEMAKGLDFFARAGFKSGEAMGVLKNQADLATVSGLEFARVADISSDLLGSFGNASLTSAKKIAALKTMNNQLAIATNRANVTLEDMFETLKEVAPIATKVRISQKELIASTAALGGAGIKGTKAGTAFKNILTRLAAPTSEVNDALGQLSLTTKDFVNKKGDMKSITDIFTLIGKKAKGISSVKQAGIFKGIFGLRAIAGSLNVVENLGKVKDIMQAMKDEKAMEKIATVMRTSLGAQIKIIKSGLTELAFKFFSAFQKDGSAALKNFSNILRNIDPTAFINDMKKAFKILKPALIGFANAFADFAGNIFPDTNKEASKLGGVLLGMAKALELALKFSTVLLKILTPFAPLLPIIVGGFIAYNLALKAIAIGTVIKSFIALIATLITVASTQGIATVAQWALNAAMTANPVGAVVAGLAVLVGVTVVVIKNWKAISAILKIGWVQFNNFRELLMLLIGPFMFWGVLISEIIRNWRLLITTFQEKGFLAGIIQIGRVIGSAILRPIEQLLFLLAKIPGVGNKIKGLAEGLRRFRQKTVLGIEPKALPGSEEKRETPGKGRTAPNQSQLDSQKSLIDFSGALNVTGAPSGSTLTGKTQGAKPIELNLLGNNELAR